jgi:hypothetical protein
LTITRILLDESTSAKNSYKSEVGILEQMSSVSKERLDEVVSALKVALSDKSLRQVPQRVVQAKVWHTQPVVAACLMELRQEEERIRLEIWKRTSNLIYQLHDHAVDATLARALLIYDSRINAGSSLDTKEAMDLFCLDSKERLYLILNQFGWLHEFFRVYPLHFYENSFTFVQKIPEKKLNVKVRVVGLGIGGSMAISGLAKMGITSAVGYEKRSESGVSGVGSRYQNASWRAYDVAKDLLDEEAYNHLVEYQQRFTVTNDDGSTKMLTSDRVQIILGSAIDAAQASAKRYGATLVFDAKPELYFDNEVNKDSVDIVALFAGAHTAQLFPGLSEQMNIHCWPELKSDCDMWLRVKSSEKKDFFCVRSGEIGAENWDYTIESARNDVEDLIRVKNSLISQYNNECKKIESGFLSESLDERKLKFEKQLSQLEKVLDFMKDKQEGRFDYIFTNAPRNEHNKEKRDAVSVDGSIVLEGEYTVEVKFAANNMVNNSEELKRKFAADLIVVGGDACVPPNPQAAYGATLACESAQLLVQLAFAYGHLNSILSGLDNFESLSNWNEQVLVLKDLFAEYYAAKSRSENYFQWVQTLICNLYSLPPQ